MHYLLSLFLSLGIYSAPQMVSVEVVSTSAGGKVYIGVFDTPDGFTEEKAMIDAMADLGKSDKHAELTIELPKEGNYVFAAFQDLNGNGELDRNMLGVPKEPFGFSKIMPSKWQSPSFEEVASPIGGVDDRVTITIKHWKEY